jgi:N-glycosylase/DNA lyase
LNELRNKKYLEIKDELVNLKGIGRKVADCICLFSMDCHEAVPVDTHAFQLAKKLGYIAQQHDKKSMSDSLYNKIAACYVSRFGLYAGWAQQVLFAGDLVMYKDKMEETTQT